MSTWEDDASCKDLGFKTPLWDPNVGEVKHKRAIAICAECPVKAPCEALGRREKYSGVWGGILLQEGVPRALKSAPGPKVTDLTGRKFGWLEVTSRAEDDELGKPRWHCLCSCSSLAVIRQAELTHHGRGARTSCGGRCSQRQERASAGGRQRAKNRAAA